jgi:hypothetical protein
MQEAQDRLAEGESLRKVCADEAMPDKTTVLRAPGPGADDPLDHHHEPSRAQEVKFEFSHSLGQKRNWPAMLKK